MIAKILLLSSLLLTGASAFAADPMDFYLRTGLFSGNFQGSQVSEGNFTSDITLEGEFWLYRSPQDAWTAGLLLANESKLGRTRYFGASLGRRYFFSGDGMATQQQVGGDLVTLRPAWSAYAGWDLRTAQFLVLPFGDVLSSYTTLAEINGTVGVRKVFSRQFSMDALFAYSYGASILSTTNVTLTSMKMFLGFGYSF